MPKTLVRIYQGDKFLKEIDISLKCKNDGVPVRATVVTLHSVEEIFPDPLERFLWDNKLRTIKQEKGRIDAIKVFREVMTNWGLLEAKNYIDLL